jgi:hypothetical protein
MDLFSFDKFLINQHASIPQKYSVLDETGRPLFYLKQKFFALRLHVEVFTDAASKDLVLLIKKDRLIQLFGTYSVWDKDHRLIGRIKRGVGLFQHKWNILDSNNRKIGEGVQEPVVAAIVSAGTVGTRGFNWRRIAHELSSFTIHMDGRQIGTFNRRFALFDRYVMDLTGDPERKLDRRIALGLAVVLDIAENW